MRREIIFEYGFKSVNGILKKVYALSDIPNIKEKCDVWNVLPIVYVRQFTGLKDKNGVEIYEGDIVRFEDYGLKTCSVVWNNRVHGFVLTTESYARNHTKLTGRGKLEVIGNIYQNPELLCA